MRKLLYHATALAERIFGRRQVVRLSRFVLNQARRDGRNDIDLNGELLVQAVVLGKAGRPATIFDVGANLGQWSTHILRASHTATNLHVFEPSSACVARLRDTLRSTADVTVMINQMAASSTEGSAVLFQPHEFAGSSSLHASSVESTEMPLEEMVATVTLDRYCRENDVEQIDLLKIDAEGHDFHVLLGAKELFERQLIQVAQFEYNHRWVGSRRYLKDVFDLAAPLDYAVGKVTSAGIEWYERWVPDLETLVEANYLMARRDAVGRFPAVRWWGAPDDRGAT